MPSYEEIFLAIATKNNFLTREEAALCLNDFNARPAGDPRSIEDLVRERQLLSDGQVRTLAAAAQKIAKGGSDTRPPAEAPPARPPTTRVPAPSGPPPSKDEPIPGIKISGKLGVGGTATVFMADDVRNGRRVALKIIHPSLVKDEKAMRRFQREASLLVSFDHENIVKGYAQGMMGPLAYLVMEFLDGESGQEVLDREKHFTEARALEIILETAKAIDYMQSRGIVHRDIKPGNIMLLRDGRVKVLDLGFAQEIKAGGAAPEEETTSGTAQYMSPEQARGAGDLDVRADIYSLGATLYHMVMGELPFSGGDSLEVMAKQVMEALNSSEIKNRRLSKHMHYFIERMMSKEKELRYSTPRELIDDINEQIEGFRSLEFRPEEEQAKSSVMRAMGRPPGGDTTRRARPPETTRRMSKLDEITKRFRKR